jgi:hypothetical protein
VTDEFVKVIGGNKKIETDNIKALNDNSIFIDQENTDKDSV